MINRLPMLNRVRNTHTVKAETGYRYALLANKEFDSRGD